MRWIRKLVILSLAGLGAYRIYELATAKADEVRTNVGPPVGDAIDTVKSTAANVKDDLAAGKADIADDLHAAVSPHEPPRMAENADRVSPAPQVDPAVESA
jgi:hypothetical protein